MYGFTLKKSFCDAWDNLISMLIANLVFLAVLLGVIFLSSWTTTKFHPEVQEMTVYEQSAETAENAVSDRPLTRAERKARAKEATELTETEKQNLLNLLDAFSYQSVPELLTGFAIFLFAVIIITILIFAYGEVAEHISNFNGAGLLDFFKKIPGVIPDAIKFGLLITFVAFFSIFSIQYYFEQGTLVATLIGALLFWIDVIFILSLQWFVAIRSTFHNKFGKCLKKCFLIFFDNTGFSILCFLWTVILLALSVLCIGFLPSMGGILINYQNAFRIRLYKYDYLEEHPELQTKRERRKIPWEELIYEDRETLGPRKFKNFLFPWKEQ